MATLCATAATLPLASPAPDTPAAAVVCAAA
eukprot:CAMPEP_0180099630 /NCGR_PEP_ID=MMETSP0985-20121206/28428_1 /TAXON_ID=483367 /ORGANISM="non described non described, Strain CCMP 2436" /LENGTH=30 /DNA_ID= /DNA_START= /DNA_END= /DNA_ORIENTATION=